MAWLAVLVRRWQMQADGAQAGVGSRAVLQGCKTGLLKLAGAVRLEQTGHPMRLRVAWAPRSATARLAQRPAFGPMASTLPCQ